MKFRRRQATCLSSKRRAAADTAFRIDLLRINRLALGEQNDNEFNRITITITVRGRRQFNQLGAISG
jgi:hypothetical protein